MEPNVKFHSNLTRTDLSTVKRAGHPENSVKQGINHASDAIFLTFRKNDVFQRWALGLISETILNSRGSIDDETLN